MCVTNFQSVYMKSNPVRWHMAIYGKSCHTGCTHMKYISRHIVATRV